MKNLFTAVMLVVKTFVVSNRISSLKDKMDIELDNHSWKEYHTLKANWASQMDIRLAYKKRLYDIIKGL